MTSDAEDLALPDHPRAAAAIRALYGRYREAHALITRSPRHPTPAEWLERWEKRVRQDIRDHLSSDEEASFVRGMRNWELEISRLPSLDRVIEHCDRAVVPLIEELRDHPEAIFARVDRERERERRREEERLRAAGPTREELAYAYAHITGILLCWIFIAIIFLVSLHFAPIVTRRWDELEPYTWILPLGPSLAGLGLLPRRKTLERHLARAFLRALEKEDRPQPTP